MDHHHSWRKIRDSNPRPRRSQVVIAPCEGPDQIFYRGESIARFDAGGVPTVSSDEQPRDAMAANTA